MSSDICVLRPEKPTLPRVIQVIAQLTQWFGLGSNSISVCIGQSQLKVNVSGANRHGNAQCATVPPSPLFSFAWMTLHVDANMITRACAHGRTKLIGRTTVHHRQAKHTSTPHG